MRQPKNPLSVLFIPPPPVISSSPDHGVYTASRRSFKVAEAAQHRRLQTILDLIRLIDKAGAVPAETRCIATVHILYELCFANKTAHQTGLELYLLLFDTHGIKPWKLYRVFPNERQILTSGCYLLILSKGRDGSMAFPLGTGRSNRARSRERVNAAYVNLFSTYHGIRSGGNPATCGRGHSHREAATYLLSVVWVCGVCGPSVLAKHALSQKTDIKKSKGKKASHLNTKRSPPIQSAI